MPAVNNDLFRIEDITHETGVISATLTINKDSEILKGHFPAHPVVPGACMLQVLKETLESTLQISVRLKKAANLKFMTMIDPANTPTVQLDLTYKFAEDGTISATTKLSNAETIYFKFQGSFIVLRPSAT